MRLTILLACTLGLGAWTVGPVRAPSPDGRDAPPTVIEVRMVDTGGGQWRFEPADIDVRPGDVVRFVQDDIAPHNVEFKDVPSGTDLGDARMGPFLLRKGDTYDVAIDDRFGLGEHKYVCTPHAPLGMVGTINVVAAAQ